MKSAFISVFVAALLSACSMMQIKPTPLPLPADAHTHAEPNRVRVTHASLDLALDFERRQAEGSVRLDLERIELDAPLVLDARALEIISVTGSAGGKRKYILGAEDPVLASPLIIELASKDESVTVYYRTTEGAEAMQWLAPEQTAGGRHPFLFTQGQAILTRTWIPLQDSPGVRITYDAKIRAPDGLTPVMSAEQLGRDDEGAWRFRMTQPIPSYLIALACGELEFREISNRCGVWAEPSIVGAARDEFVDTEVMIQSAEALFGPYRWERYDLIVLPPSFPFGGMENPRLTFATPTILAGDRSLVGLVAHELAHSWSGNLVTNATWRDFWLNEGFTVYFEQRIMEEVFGPERSNMEKVLGVNDYLGELPTLDSSVRMLHVDLTGKNPDDAMTQVAYEKGACFLRRVEELVGRADFDHFLRGWFDEHAFQSVTTEQFIAYLQRELLAARPDAASKLDLEEWLHGGGVPADLPRPRSTMLEATEAQVARWNAGTSADQLVVTGWATQQWLRFLDALPAQLDVKRMSELDRNFGFTESGNCEIQCAWLLKCIKNGYSAADARLTEFLLHVGRRKFLKPLYAALAMTPEGLKRAREVYARARPRYHAVSVRTLDEILGWNPDSAAGGSR